MYQECETERNCPSQKGFTEGFSLVEMLIAVAVSAIVMTALLALLGYTMRSTSQTQTRVAIQNEAKDAANHMVSHTIEGNHVTWKASQNLMIIERDEEVDETDPSGVTVKKLKKKETYYYYLSGSNLYFKNVSGGDTSLTADKKHLLCEDVESFSAKPDDEDESTVHIELKLNKDLASEYVFECKQDVHIRNKCKGGGVHDS